MSTHTKSKLYKTETTIRRRLRVAYPPGNVRLVLSIQQDWDKNIAPVERSEDGSTWTVELEADQPFLYFKPCLIRGDEFSLGLVNVSPFPHPRRKQTCLPTK